MVDASLNEEATSSSANGASGTRPGDSIDPINVIIDKLQKYVQIICGSAEFFVKFQYP
jgi:hypothetical protein